MQEDRRDDILRHFPTFLNRWSGVDGRLWELSSSHPILRIVIYDHDRSGSLEVLCIDPERIEAPTRWKNTNIRIEKTENGFDVLDEGAGIRISNCGVEIKEFPTRPWER
jgi:hypothetical protein